MNIQILPYLFKKIGLLLFLLGPITLFLTGMYEGVTNPFESNEAPIPTTFVDYLLETVSLLGILLYFLSKERVEDELIKRLRLESMSVAFIVTLAILLFLHLVYYSTDANINASLMFYLQLTLFLLIYHYKKRNFSL